MTRWVANTSAGTGAMERVKIVTRGARRDYTAKEKAAFLAEASEPGARVLEVAQRHGISPSLICAERPVGSSLHRIVHLLAQAHRLSTENPFHNG